jgi:hypothetical protein
VVVGAVRRGGEWEIGRWRRERGEGRCDVEDDVSGPFVGREKREKPASGSSTCRWTPKSRAQMVVLWASYYGITNAATQNTTHLV